MTNEHPAAQAELAASILRTGHPWERCHQGSSEWDLAGINTNPLKYLDSGMQIRLALATPGDGRKLHNPHNLTAEQVGAGWRLCINGELFSEASEIWDNDSNSWRPTMFASIGHKPMQSTTTRLPLSTPWPEAPKVDEWKLPEPPKGREWHLAGKWTKEMLPDGHRPLLKDEMIVAGDEWLNSDGWTVHERHSASVSNYLNDGQDWVEHRTRRPIEERPIKPAPVMVALEAKDVPPCSMFRLANEGRQFNCVAPVGISSWCVRFQYNSCLHDQSYADLMKAWQINRSIPLTGKWDAEAWEACEKESV